MPRTPWKPTREQRQRLARIRRLIARRDGYQQAIDAELAALADDSAPADGLGKELGMDRKAVARHVTAGRSAATNVEETP